MPMISPSAISPHNHNLCKKAVPPQQPKEVNPEAHEARRAGWLVTAVTYFRKLLTVKTH